MDFYGNIKANSIDVSITVAIRSTADNSEVTGIVASGIIFQYYRQGNIPVLFSCVDLLHIDSQHTDGGWKEIDSVNQKGLYRLDIPDSAILDGSDWVILSVNVNGCFIFYERYNLQLDLDKQVLSTNVSTPADFFGNIKADSKDVSLVCTLRNVTNNQEVTGKVASGVGLQYYRQGGLPVLYSLTDLATIGSGHSDGGWKEVDSVNQRGLYRVDIPDAAIASGADWVTISITSNGCFVFHERYNLQIDPGQTETVDLSYNNVLQLNSYVNLEYANTYFSGRLNTDAWDNSNLIDQQKSLIQSTRIIDNLNIAGFKADPNQLLQFPRISRNPNTNPLFLYYLSDPLYNDGELEPTSLPTPILPEDIQIATCEIALALLDERDPDMDYENLRMVSGGMSGSRVTYDPATQQEHTRAGVPSVSAWRRLRPYLVDPNTIELRRVN